MSSTDKLISADAFFKRICDDTSVRGSAFAAIRRHLDATPAVEAEEVVRCKDCKFGSCMTALKPDEVCCELHDFTLWKADGFCSLGERREGE